MKTRRELLRHETGRGGLCDDVCTRLQLRLIFALAWYDPEVVRASCGTRHQRSRIELSFVLCVSFSSVSTLVSIYARFAVTLVSFLVCGNLGVSKCW